MTYYHLSFIPAHFRNDIFYIDTWIPLPFTFLSTLIQLSQFFMWSSNSAVQLPLLPHTASSVTKGAHSSACPWVCQRRASIRCWSCSRLRSGLTFPPVGLGGKLGPMELYTGACSNAKSWDHRSCYRRCHKVMSPAFYALSEKGLGTTCPLLQAAVSTEISKVVLKRATEHGWMPSRAADYGVTGGGRKSPFI